MRGPCEKSGESEEQEKEVAAVATAAGRPAGVPEAGDSDTDSDSNLETEGASGQGMLGWSHLWGFFGRSGRDRLGSSGQGPLSSRAGSSALRGTPSAQPVAATPCAFPAMLLGHQRLHC